LASALDVAAVASRVRAAAADAAARALAVLAVERVGDFHTLDDLAERHAALGVLIRVVAQADIDLRRTPTWNRKSERDPAASVRLFRRVVGDGPRPPRGGR